ncbi:MAG: hypothetical protein AB1758_05700 [Candidatus Eremiobacterota bacterium]
MFFTSPVLRQGLEAAWRTHREAAHNLANLDTPGFSSRETDFKSLLMEERPGGAPPRGAAFEAYLRDVAGARPGVNVEAELARLSQAGLEHAALVEMLNGRYAKLRTAITEGKR